MPEEYTLKELMVVRASKEIKDGEKVFIGTGLPMIAGMLAKYTHAPNCVIIFEAGTVDSKLLDLPASVGDPRCVYGASTCTGLFDIFSMLQDGKIDIGFLGGGQVDKYGNLNSTAIGEYRCPEVRFPGSGGACDMACLSKRVVIIMKHELRRFPAEVDYLTSPGWMDGPGGREKAGLVRGGPTTVITDLGVMKFDPSSKEMYLDSYYPGVSIEKIRENTGFDIDCSRAGETEKPHIEEIALLRNKIAPKGSLR